jgi:hypothetical protein
MPHVVCAEVRRLALFLLCIVSWNLPRHHRRPDPYRSLAGSQTEARLKQKAERLHVRRLQRATRGGYTWLDARALLR